MNAFEIFGLLAVAAGVASYVPYIAGIYRGWVRPHMFTWLVWGVMAGIIASAQVTGGAGPGAWALMLSCAFCAGVVLWSLRRGERNITRFDRWCLAGALAAIPLWVLTRDPLASVLLVTAINAVAFMPTVRKSWDRPWQESCLTFALAAAGFGLSIAAMETVSLVTALYPAALAVMNTAFVVMVLLRRRAVPVA